MYSVPSPASTDSPPTRTLVISPFSTPIEMCTWLGRPIFTPCRLSIGTSVGRRHDLVAHEVAAERTACAAGRRILGDADFRREHPAVDRRLVRRRARARTGRRRDASRPAVRKNASIASKLLAALSTAPPRRERDKEKRHAARDDLHRQTGAGDRRLRQGRARRPHRRSPRSAPKTGRCCVIHAKLRSLPRHVSDTGVGPMPRPNTKSFRAGSSTPARASANVLPMVGWPAIGSSAARREDAEPEVGVRAAQAAARTSSRRNSSPWRSPAWRSSGRPRPSRNTASWLPPNSRSVKTS